METDSQENQAASSGLQPWLPHEHIRKVSAEEARYACGFLRSRPERWFPGFSAQWLPLAHSLGWDLRCVDIKPVIRSAFDLTRGYVAAIDDEPIGLALDENSADFLANAAIPGVAEPAKDLIIEYIARRFLQSLGSVWSAADQAVIRYRPDIEIQAIKGVAAVDLIISVNGTNLKGSIMLGRTLTDRFDGLWRRQLLANSRLPAGPKKLEIELAHLVVAPTMLAQYLKSGTDIDLDHPVTDRVTIYTGEQPWLAGRMVRIEERLGLQVSNGAPAQPILPDGTTRLSIQLGQAQVNPEQQIELAQAGAILTLDFSMSDQVTLVVGNQPVGSARLKVYQGRFAITVL